MRRRTVLQSLAALVVARPVSLAARRTQMPATFSADQVATLEAMAGAALPSSLDAAARTRVVTAFADWHREYREGAERGHGYGSGRISAPTGPAPARRYPEQFAALDAAARQAGAASFATAGVDLRRTIVRAALDEPRVNGLPGSPTGNNLVADFLGFYFNSPDAWDLAYQASIRRDSCRGLSGSDRPPEPLRGRS
jgi:hypothetical protein